MSEYLNEKQRLLTPKRTFHIRPSTLADGPAIYSIEEHTSKFSTTSTLTEPAPLSEQTGGIQWCLNTTESLHAVAMFGPSTNSTDGSEEHSIDGVEEGQFETTESKIPYGILGYVTVVPWQPNRGPRRDCYDHVARMTVTTLEENLLDPEFRYAVSAALIDYTVVKVKERNPNFQSIVHNVRIPAGELANSTLYNALLQKGFEQVGRVKKAAAHKSNDGTFYDHLILQREF